MRRERVFRLTGLRRALAGLTLLLLMLLPAQGVGVAAGTGSSSGGSLTSAQRAILMGIAKDTWRFYAADVDPATHLPLDNLGPNGKRGTYTSAANIGVYLWAVVAAHDLGLIGRGEARSQIAATLTEVGRLQRDHGFLYQWYD